MSLPEDEIKALIDGLDADEELQLTPPEAGSSTKRIDVEANEGDAECAIQAEKPASLIEEPRDGSNDDANDAAIDFDPFEPGCLWTQGASTQMQQRTWRRGWQVSSSPSYDALSDDGNATSRFPDDERQTERTYEDELGGPSRRGSESPGRRPPVADSDVIDLANSQDEMTTGNDQSRQRDTRSDGQDPRSWWNKGKTAPLLHDFDEERRAWYMEQAGLYDQSSSVHGAEARQDVRSGPLAAQTSAITTPQRVLIMGARTLHSATTPTSADQSPSQGQGGAPILNTRIPAIANTPRTPFAIAQPRAVQSAPRLLAASSALQTPKRKTWNTTWGSVTSEDRTPAGMHKRGGRGGAATTPASANTGSSASRRLRTSFHTSTPTASAGRGRGSRGRGSVAGASGSLGRSALRGRGTGNRGGRIATSSTLR